MTKQWRENPLYRKVRKIVRKRDNYCCQMCGSKNKIIVHHIIKWSKSPSLRYNTFNLIVLCRICHDSIRGKEHIYEKQFLRKARENSKNV